MSTTQSMLFHLGGMPAGTPLGLVPSKTGKVFFADYANGSNSNDGTHKFPFKTISYAHTRMTADQNDTLFLLGGVSATTYAFREAATLTWSKNSCHLIGLNALSRYAHRVSIRVTSGTTVYTPFVNVTGSGCVFANIHTFVGFDDASAQINWQDTGDRNVYLNMHFGGMAHATAAAHAGGRSLKLYGGGERLFKDCVIGLDTVTRSAANASLELTKNASSVAATRDIFENCIFPVMSSAATPVMVLANDSGGIDRTTIFDQCLFLNAINSTSTNLTQAFLVHATVGGTLLLKYPTLTGCADHEDTPSGNVMVVGPTTAAATGLAVDVD